MTESIDDLYARLTAQGVRVKYQDKAHRSLLIGECDVAVGSKSGAITYTCRTGAHSAEQIQAQPISQAALGGGGNSEAGGSSQANAPADGWSTGAPFTTSRHEIETGVRGESSKNGAGGQADNAPGETSAGIPFFITRTQKARLGALGYDDDAIAKMRPEEAQAILRDGYPAVEEPAEHFNGVTQTEQMRLWKERIRVLAYRLIQADSAYHKAHLTFKDIVEPLRQEVFTAVRSSLFNIEYAVYKAPEWADDDELWAAIGNACEIAWDLFRQADRNDILLANGNGKPKELEPPSVDLPKLLNLGQLYDLVDEWDRQPWIWDGILPHASLSLLTGKSETGKSTLVYGLIYAIIKGLEFFGRQCQQGSVLYLAGDPVSEIVAGKTFRAMGLTPGIDPVHVVPGALVSQPTGMQMLRAWVKDLKPILVVGDTLAATVPIDVDKYGQSYEVQQPLTQIARSSSANFLMSHHSQKSAIDSYSVIDAALGSVGVAAVASTRMATRMYRRAGKRYYTFEMSSLRIGHPLEGEHLVHKLDDGRIELGELWGRQAQEMDRELIFNVLARLGNGEAISERTLWNEIFPKPKWNAFKPALEAMVESGQVLKQNRSKKGGGKQYSLASKSYEGNRSE